MNNLIAYLALWDKNFGSKILDFYPKTTQPKFDLEFITSKIFFAFQNLNEDETTSIKKSFFKLPFKEINKKALILLDVLESEDNNENNKPLYIVVLLFPDFISNEDLEGFKNIISEIANEYLTTENILFDKHLKKIEEKFLLEEQVRDSEVSLEENYSLNKALLDFKNGIELFSKKKYDQAYFLIKKAYLKFYDENQTKLILETTFYISSLLSQLNKFDVALIYIENLENLAYQLKHEKYYETALFLGGFVYYKKEDYENALKKFKKLESINPQSINKFNFFFFYGRILRILKINSDAVTYLQRALEESKYLKVSNELKNKMAQVLVELGHLNYTNALNILISGKSNHSLYKSTLLKSIEYYEDTISILHEIENYSGLISVYRLIGNIYELIEENSLSIKNYRKALNFAEQINDIANRLQIFNLIIQKLSILGKYDLIIKETDQMLSKIVTYAYLDLFTISNFHRYLGEALFKLGKNKSDALSELLISLNIYNTFDKPVSESLDILQMIIKIYEDSNNKEKKKYIQYYSDQYNQIKTKIHQLKAEEEKGVFILLKEVKEFWIFTSDGKQLYSYAPETNYNPELFGGFLSALQNFSLELASKNLKSITIGLDQYVIYRQKHPFYVLGRSSHKTSLYNIEMILKIIYEEFWKNYQKVLEDHDVNISYFSQFIEIFKELNYKDEFS
ncbi:MAG: tetratricopeptide repeat protein [Promethearchaeota archaeon]